jgi:hypothetical protein
MAHYAYRCLLRLCPMHKIIMMKIIMMTIYKNLAILCLMFHLLTILEVQSHLFSDNVDLIFEI